MSSTFSSISIYDMEKNPMKAILGIFFMFVIVFVLPGCDDMGSDLPNTPTPIIRAVRPDSGKAGDTVRISGSRFGTTRSSSVVRFGGTDVQTYFQWGDTAIVVLVPVSSTSGTVTVTVGAVTSNALSFRVIGATTIVRSFANDVLPRLSQYGCIGCHGGNGGLFVDTQPHLLQGGNHGPAVIAGNADGSILIKKISTTPPFGDRMPQGGPFLADSTIQVIKDWINQGALDN